MALWRGPELIFDRVNPKYQAIFGDRPLVGRSLAEATPELVAQGFHELLIRVLETGKPYVAHEMLARIEVAPGRFEDHYYDFTYVRVVDAEGRPYGVYDHAIDVTDRVRARRAMEQERDLRERLVTALSHDLRTPLGTARLGAEMILATDPHLAKQVNRIITAMDRADAMIRDLLDVSRIRAGEPIPLDVVDCDLSQLAHQSIDELAALHGARFVVHAPPHVEGRWDCGALRRVIENLVNNAVKYGARDAPITISIARGERVTLSVHNEGIPIPGDEQPALFELFKRSRNATAHDGWGIGLSLVHGLVQAHGGTVRVSSAEGRGTTFTVELPLEPQQ